VLARLPALPANPPPSTPDPVGHVIGTAIRGPVARRRRPARLPSNLGIGITLE
jgi:hypothetical protein